MTAQQIFDQHQKAKAQWEAMGSTYSNPFGSMTVEQIQAHLDLCKAFETEFHHNCDPGKMIGKTESEIRAIMEANAKSYRRGAGARALKAKYGHDAACKITGKNLKN